MVTTGALIHGDRERFLRYSECEHPIALQRRKRSRSPWISAPVVTISV
jgi:tRNA-dihydrouridine synthase